MRFWGAFFVKNTILPKFCPNLGKNFSPSPYLLLLISILRGFQSSRPTASSIYLLYTLITISAFLCPINLAICNEFCRETDDRSQSCSGSVSYLWFQHRLVQELESIPRSVHARQYHRPPPGSLSTFCRKPPWNPYGKNICFSACLSIQMHRPFSFYIHFRKPDWMPTE